MKKSRKFLNILLFILMLGVCITTNVYADDCPLGAEVTKDVSGALRIFKIVGPALCIALSSFDVVQAITKGEIDSEGKKVAGRFGKRLMYTIILLFITVLVDAFMQLLNVWDINGECEFDETYDTMQSAGGSSSSGVGLKQFEAAKSGGKVDTTGYYVTVSENSNGSCQYTLYNKSRNIVLSDHTGGVGSNVVCDSSHFDYTCTSSDDNSSATCSVYYKY